MLMSHFNLIVWETNLKLKLKIEKEFESSIERI
jgi:hypothetical protein